MPEVLGAGLGDIGSFPLRLLLLRVAFVFAIVGVVPDDLPGLLLRVVVVVLMGVAMVEALVESSGLTEWGRRY